MRLGASTGKIALVPMLQETLAAVRTRTTLIAQELARQGGDILADIESEDDQRRRDAYSRALGWYRQAKNFLEGGR